MKTKFLALAGLVAVPLLWTSTAQAQDYCREYQRSIVVGGMTQNGYGTACYMPDGSWKIVDLQGPQQAQYAVREQIFNDFGQNAPPVIYANPRPVVYYQPAPVYRPMPRQSSVYFSFGNDRRWDRHDHRWDRRWDRDDRWDDRRGRGRGHRH